MELVILKCLECGARLPGSLQCDYCRTRFLLEDNKVLRPIPKPAPVQPVAQAINTRAAEVVTSYRRSSGSWKSYRHHRKPNVWVHLLLAAILAWSLPTFGQPFLLGGGVLIQFPAPLSLNWFSFLFLPLFFFNYTIDSWAKGVYW